MDVELFVWSLNVLMGKARSGSRGLEEPASFLEKSKVFRGQVPCSLLKSSISLILIYFLIRMLA